MDIRKESDLEFLAGCTALRSVKLAAGRGYSTQRLLLFIQPCGWPSSPHLCEVSLDRIVLCDWSALGTLRLTVLKLRDIAVSSKSLAQLIAVILGLRCLQELELSGLVATPQMPYDSTQGIAVLPTKLEHLEMLRLWDLSPKHMEMILGLINTPRCRVYQIYVKESGTFDDGRLVQEIIARLVSAYQLHQPRTRLTRMEFDGYHTMRVEMDGHLAVHLCLNRHNSKVNHAVASALCRVSSTPSGISVCLNRWNGVQSNDLIPRILQLLQAVTAMEELTFGEETPGPVLHAALAVLSIRPADQWLAPNLSRITLPEGHEYCWNLLLDLVQQRKAAQASDAAERPAPFTEVTLGLDPYRVTDERSQIFKSFAAILGSGVKCYHIEQELRTRGADIRS